MNILIPAIADGSVSLGGQMVGLSELASQLDTQFPAPTNQAENELYEQARIRLMPDVTWTSLRDGYEYLEGPLAGTWCEVVPVKAAGLVAFLPNDDRLAPEVALFSRFTDMPGRLRFAFAGGFGSPVTGVTFEATLHCADAECAGNEDCSGCCGSCRCRTRILEGTTISVLRCGCTVHFSG